MKKPRMRKRLRVKKTRRRKTFLKERKTLMKRVKEKARVTTTVRNPSNNLVSVIPT